MNRPLFFILIAFILSCVVMALVPFIGMKAISLKDVFWSSNNHIESQIFWKIRFPRACLSFLAGSALAVSGMTFQAIFRNALATPFTLGVSSGASLGATIYVFMGFTFSVMGLSGGVIFAFVGAILSILFVYGLSVKTKGFNSSTMLLAGVAISMFFLSFIQFLQYFSDFQRSFRIVRWLMGGLETVGYQSVFNILPFTILGCVLIARYYQELNLLNISDDLAISRGVEIKKSKKVLFFATSMMVGAVVSFCGPIGFVGMIVPHICRLIIGPLHQYLIPLTFLMGGVFLSICDMFARTLIAPAEIPVGVITSLLGGPFFLWLLVRGVARNSE